MKSFGIIEREKDNHLVMINTPNTCQSVWCKNQILQALEQSTRSVTDKEDEEDDDECGETWAYKAFLVLENLLWWCVLKPR